MRQRHGIAVPDGGAEGEDRSVKDAAAEIGEAVALLGLHRKTRLSVHNRGGIFGKHAQSRCLCEHGGLRGLLLVFPF